MSDTNPGATRLVCRCGVHARGRLTFGADGCCTTCGDPLVICADPRSAEMAAAAISERDGLRGFAAHVGTIVGADPSDLKALEAALKRIILTIGAQRWTADDVARLDDELREKMSRALDNARAKARQEAAEALATVEAERDALRAELEALRGQQGQPMGEPSPPMWLTQESIDIVGAAERIRITAAIRRRAANRRAQMPACEAGGGHIDALTAKASECEAIVDWLAGGGR
jgi:hypothetical protein